MSKQYKITIIVPADDQFDMTDGDYTLEDFQQIINDGLKPSGSLTLCVKTTAVTVEEVK